MAKEPHQLKLAKEKKEDQGAAVLRAQELAQKKNKNASLIREDKKYWYFKFY